MRAFPGCTIYFEKHVHLKEVWVLFEGVHCWFFLKLIGNCCISAPWMEIHPESCIVHFITHFSCNNYGHQWIIESIFCFLKWISLLVLDTEILMPDIKPVCRATCVASRCDPNKYGMNCFVTGDDFMPASCFAYWNYAIRVQYVRTFGSRCSGDKHEVKRGSCFLVHFPGFFCFQHLASFL